MTLTAEQERRRENMRGHRRTAATNLRAARRLHRQGDVRGTEFLESYRRAVVWGVTHPNPDRRADLLKCAARLKATLDSLEEGRAERRDQFSAEEWEAGEQVLQTLRQGMDDTYAMADAARY